MELCDGAREWWPVVVVECPETLMFPLLVAADEAGVRRMLLGPAVIGVELGATAWTGI